MALQKSTTLRNAQLDQIETTIGTAPRLKIYTGSPPANCGTAASGTLLADITCPSDWAAAASSGSKTFLGTWQDLTADGTGTAGYWRLLASDNTTVHMQGTITTVAVGTGDMLLDNTSIVTGQPINISAFTLNAPGA